MSKYWEYVKKRPGLFIGAAVVFGLLLFAVTRSGGSASASGPAVVSSGPSEALQAQAMAINAGVATAQLSANVELQRGAMELEALSRQIEGQENLAVLAMRNELAQMETSRAISSEQTAASLAALTAQLSYGMQTQEINNQASVDMARIAADSNTQQLMINATMQSNMVAQTVGLQKEQLRTQSAMFAAAQETSFLQSAMATIPQLKGSTGARVLTEIVNQPRNNAAALIADQSKFTQAPPALNMAVML